MTANTSLFKTLAIAFVLVLVGVACTETASGDVLSADPGENTERAAEAPGTDADTDVVEEAHAEDDDHAEEVDHAEEAHAEDDDHGAGEATEAGRVVEVTMSEFAFDPGSLEVAAGETITFVVTNAGVVEHEFRLSNQHRIEEHKASGHAEHGEEGEDGHHQGGDMVLLLAAGESGEMTVTFPDDTTVFTQIACLIPGHHEAGMGGAIDYTP